MLIVLDIYIHDIASQTDVKYQYQLIYIQQYLILDVDPEPDKNFSTDGIFKIY